MSARRAPPHVRAVLNRLPRMEDDEDDVPESMHFPAAELDTAVPCRHPLDPPPYPEEEVEQPDDGSFPSIFQPAATGVGGDGDLADAELKHSWDRVQALITKCLETDSTPADTVEMVHTFYNEQIRTQFTEAPEWTRKSIYGYIYRNYDRQAAEAIHATHHAMEFLRTQMATKRDDGAVKINTEAVKLFLASAKVHAGLLDAKRKREQR
jgi:hypothetical protein